MITSKPTGSSKPEGKKLLEPREGQGKNWKRSQDQSQKKREPLQFTPLNITYERLLPVIHKWPMPILTDPSKRNTSLRCDYDRDQGHETNRCRSLKFLMERLIKEGHLRRYIRKVNREEESALVTPQIIPPTIL